MVSKKLYYLDDLKVGDTVRCRSGRAWVLLPKDKGTAQLIEMDNIMGIFLGSIDEEAFIFIDNKIRQLSDSHSTQTRWEIME